MYVYVFVFVFVDVCVNVCRFVCVWSDTVNIGPQRMSGRTAHGRRNTLSRADRQRWLPTAATPQLCCIHVATRGLTPDSPLRARDEPPRGHRDGKAWGREASSEHILRMREHRRTRSFDTLSTSGLVGRLTSAGQQRPEV